MSLFIKQATKSGWIELNEGGVFDASFPGSSTRRGRVQEHGEVCPTLTAQNMEIYKMERVTTRLNDVSNTIRASFYKNGERNMIENVENAKGYEGIIEKYRIRKLTPKECWRLQAFTDEQHDRAEAAGVSATQRYKQAGNSITVDVLFYIFKELYQAMPYLFEDLKLCSLFSGIGAPEAALDKLYKEVINAE